MVGRDSVGSTNRTDVVTPQMYVPSMAQRSAVWLCGFVATVDIGGKRVTVRYEFPEPGP
jgi:hypothetical protein